MIRRLSAGQIRRPARHQRHQKIRWIQDGKYPNVDKNDPADDSKFTIEWQKIGDGRLVRLIEMVGDRGSIPLINQGVTGW